MGIVQQEKDSIVAGGKKKVYFLGHPNGNAVLQDIIKDFTKKFDCTWHFNDIHTESTIQNDENFIEEMDLIVFIISKDFLGEYYGNYESVFKYALENNKLMLPILVESNIEQSFNDICGHFHMIKRFEENYLLQLYKFIDDHFNIYINLTEVTNPIQGSVFLSYRKKDIGITLKLIEEIRSFDFGKNFEIWFDNHLTAGENYNDEIDRKLRESNFVILLVTKSLIEQGNYIEQIEYPMAQKYNKDILPIFVEDVDINKLDQLYPGLMNEIDIDGNFEMKLKKLMLSNGMKIESLSTIEKRELGIKYEEGETLEKNSNLAIELLREAAIEGDAPAASRLGYIYYENQLVPRNLNETIYWTTKSSERLAPLFEKSNDLFEMNTNGVTLAKNFYRLFEIYYQEDDIERAFEAINNYNYYAEKLNNQNMVTERVNIGLGSLGISNLFKKIGEFSKALEYSDHAERFFENSPLKLKLTRITIASLYDSRAQIYKKLYEIQKEEDYLAFAIKEYDKAFKEFLWVNDATRTHYEHTFLILSNFSECAYRVEVEIGNIDLASKLYIYLYNSANKLLLLLNNDVDSDVEAELLCLMARLAINIAVVGIDRPDLNMLKKALEHIEDCLDKFPQEESYLKLHSNILHRIMIWPENIG